MILLLLVANYPLSWLARRCTPLNLNPGGCAFWLICPCHELLMAGPAGALYLVTIHWPWQGTNVFLGSVSRTRGRKEISFFFHRPRTWWVPGSRSISIRNQYFWKSWRRRSKGANPALCFVPAKMNSFLRWISILYWQGPFNGCQYHKMTQISDTYAVSVVCQILLKLLYSPVISNLSFYA